MTIGKLYLGDTPITCNESQGVDEAWIRPAEWPALPTIAEGEEKVAGLMAVFDTSAEYFSLVCRGDGLEYTVDWGDGNIEDFYSEDLAYHKYEYATISGTPTAQGYKIVPFSVYPKSTSPGNLGILNFNIKHPDITIDKEAPSELLELKINLPFCVSLEFATEDTYNIRYNSLQNIEVLSHSLTSATRLFSYITPLTKVAISLEGVTDTSYMFEDCYELRDIPIFDMSTVENVEGMFSNCRKLKTAQLVNTSNVTNTSNLFIGCHNLLEVSLFDTSSVETMVSMFLDCQSLKTIPAFNTENVTDMSMMFLDCFDLETVPLLDTSSVTSFSSMFHACYSLNSIPHFDTSAGLNFFQMFRECRSLRNIPVLETSQAEDMNIMFSDSGIVTVPALSMEGTTTDNYQFVSDYFTKRVKVFGGTTSVTYANTSLSSEALNEIFTNLGIAANGATITITDSLGAADADTTIATAKGWLVIGGIE